MRKLLFVVLACSVLGYGQNVRYDAPFPSVSSSSPPFLVANVPPNSPTIQVCKSPANGVPCSNFTTTFDSLGNACPSGSQDTPQPQPSACQATADSLGNIGFWAPAGTLDYTVCISNNCFGPYTVTLGGSGGSTGDCTATNCVVTNPASGQNIISPPVGVQGLVIKAPTGELPTLDEFQLRDQSGNQQVGFEAGGNAQFGPNTEGPHVVNVGGGTSGLPAHTEDCDSYGAFYGTSNQLQTGCTAGIWTVIFGGQAGQLYTAPWMAFSDAFQNLVQGAVLCYNGQSYVNCLTIPSTVVSQPSFSSGTSHTFAPPYEDFRCTNTCTLTVPPPVSGFKFCAYNDVNVSSVITFGAIGSAAMYGNTANTAYGTAGTGTIHSGGAATDRICFEAADATHYNVISSTGTWTGSTASPTFTVVQIYATNTNANVNGDTCAGFLTPGSNTCTFHPVGALQAAANTAVVGCSAQAAGINASQTCVFTDSTGSVYTHPASCATFFPGNPKIVDCGYTTNTVGSGSPFTVSVTVTTPIATGQRMGFVYAELLPSTGTGTLDGIGKINDNTACGTTTPCNGVPAANLSPAMAGTADGCVQMIIAGAGQQSVNSPWSGSYANNGDHSAFSAAVGLNNAYTPPLWTSNATASGAGLAICFK